MNRHNPYDLPPGPKSVDQLDLSPSNDERNLAMIAHLSGCAGVLGAGFLGFIGPLVIYLIKKDSSPYVEFQAKEALNFQITIFLLSIAAWILTLLSCSTLFLVVFAPMVLQIALGILAALAVRNGKNYRYPINFRLLQ